MTTPDFSSNYSEENRLDDVNYIVIEAICESIEGMMKTKQKALYDENFEPIPLKSSPKDLYNATKHLREKALKEENLGDLFKEFKNLLESKIGTPNFYFKYREKDWGEHKWVRFDTPLTLAVNKSAVGLTYILLNKKLNTDINCRQTWVLLPRSYSQKFKKSDVQLVDPQSPKLKNSPNEAHGTMTNRLLAYEHIKKHFGTAQKVGWTPLHIACNKGDLTFINILLENEKIDVNAGCSRLEAYSHSAYLDERKKEKDYQRYWATSVTPLHLCVANANPDLISRLFKHPKVDVNAIKNQYLIEPEFILSSTIFLWDVVPGVTPFLESALDIEKPTKKKDKDAVMIVKEQYTALYMTLELVNAVIEKIEAASTSQKKKSLSQGLVSWTQMAEEIMSYEAPKKKKIQTFERSNETKRRRRNT